MAKTRLGTQKWFVVHTVEGSSDVYTLTVTQSWRDIVYRVAPENPKKPAKGQGWRVDWVSSVQMPWEAVTEVVFTSAKAAAAWLVSRF